MMQCSFDSALTSNPDVCFLALLGSGGAPGDTLTPVLIQSEDLLHLLPGYFDCHLHDWQCWRAKTQKSQNVRHGTSPALTAATS